MTAMSPDDIASARFPTRTRGYDRSTVDDFLERVAQDYRRALGQAPALEPYRRLGDEVGGFLQHAHEAAERMVAEAEATRVEADQELRAARRTGESAIDKARKEGR